MISWIVASHDPSILNANLRSSLVLEGADELIVVEDAPSIAVAYNRGQGWATQPIRCYVHHDVEILNSPRLRAGLVAWCTPSAGMVGIVGSRIPKVPWWKGDLLGSVIDSRDGILNFGPGGEAAYLDGQLLATVQHIDWDETYPGWHLYDHDACQQMLTRGLPNWCLDNGYQLVKHNTTGSSNTDTLAHYHDNIARFRQKWGDVEGSAARR